MIDSFKHKGNRNKLIEILKKKGISDEKVLEAINKVPRHIFMDSAFEQYAYEDKAFPIAAEQTISQPYTVAFQTQLLQLSKGEKVMEIGTGSGYQTAVLLNMNVEVYTIERQKTLFEFSNLVFKKLKLKPKHQKFGDGYEGIPTFAPFDKILVTAGAEILPKTLLEQLKIGGIMVIPLGKKTQIMTSFLRLDEKNYEKTEFGIFQFVPLLEKTDKLK